MASYLGQFTLVSYQYPQETTHLKNYYYFWPRASGNSRVVMLLSGRDKEGKKHNKITIIHRPSRVTSLLITVVSFLFSLPVSNTEYQVEVPSGTFFFLP